MNKLILSSLLLFTLSMSALTCVAAASDDSTLKHMIQTSNDPTILQAAITEALNAQDGSVLLAGMENPNLDVKIAVIEAIGKLQHGQAAVALANILERGDLWAYHAKGGEALVIQERFNATVQRTYFEITGQNPVPIELYNKATRESLVETLRKK